ncbi:MAG TPA: SatD family protein [Bacteroidales bacterium]|nr:SatD family protein [Bacteroidales bacterium]
MPSTTKTYAVITGDIVDSSRFTGEERRQLLGYLKNALAVPAQILGNEVMAFPFEIHRGDGFQGVLQQPTEALKAAIIIRAALRSSIKTTLSNTIDARIAIGIGSIILMPDATGGEGDGEAYRNSGLQLDRMMQNNRMLFVRTPNDEINKELNVECALLDAIVTKWSAEQAMAIIEFLKGKTQQEMAEAFDISQPAIGKRLLSANLYAFELALNRYDELMQKI